MKKKIPARRRRKADNQNPNPANGATEPQSRYRRLKQVLAIAVIPNATAVLTLTLFVHLSPRFDYGILEILGTLPR